jgi:hypothetical protein
LLRQLVTARAGTPVSYDADVLEAQVAALASLGPTYIPFEVSGGLQPVTLTNNGDGSYTSTRSSGTAVNGAVLIRSTAAIAGNFLLEIEALQIGLNYTQGFFGVDDAQPSDPAIFNAGPTILAGALPATDGFLYTKSPGDTVLVNASWGNVMAYPRCKLRSLTLRLRVGPVGRITTTPAASNSGFMQYETRASQSRPARYNPGSG